MNYKQYNQILPVCLIDKTNAVNAFYPIGTLRLLFNPYLKMC